MPEESISTDRVDQMLRAAFEALQEAGGSARARDVLAAVESKLGLSAHEKSRTKTGAIRWEVSLRFHTNHCGKAGYLKKADGRWFLTDEGKAALALPPGELVRSAIRKYTEWRRLNLQPTELAPEGLDEAELQIVEEDRQTVYEIAVETAESEIDTHIRKMDPFDFQRLVGELLIAMGYYVPFVSTPGPDGGIDLVAYKDPLGTATPRVKVQVKHRDSKVTEKEVRELEGLLRRDDDMGLFVSLSGFTSGSERELRSSKNHIETIDLERLIRLWKQHYERISEVGKNLLPLTPVYFLTPREE